MIFRSIGESESENVHLARLWREGSPERQLVALSAELRRNGLLLKITEILRPPQIKQTPKLLSVCITRMQSPLRCGLVHFCRLPVLPA